MLKHINLQLFSEEGETGAVIDGVADQNPAPAEAQGGDKTEKDPAKAFAARLGHERKKMEGEYAPYRAVIEKQAKAAGMESGEYLKYIQEQQELEELETEADKTGKTPEQIRAERKEAEAQAKLERYEKKEKLSSEEKELVGDPKIGKFVADNLQRIRDIAESTETDLRTGLALVLTEKLPELLDMADIEKHKDQIIKDYLDSVKKGGKPIEIGGGAPLPDSKTPKTFDEARRAAVEILRGANSS